MRGCRFNFTFWVCTRATFKDSPPVFLLVFLAASPLLLVPPFPAATAAWLQGTQTALSPWQPRRGLQSTVSPEGLGWPWARKRQGAGDLTHAAQGMSGSKQTTGVLLARRDSGWHGWDFLSVVKANCQGCSGQLREQGWDKKKKAWCISGSDMQCLVKWLRLC